MVESLALLILKAPLSAVGLKLCPERRRTARPGGHALQKSETSQTGGHMGAPLRHIRKSSPPFVGAGLRPARRVTDCFGRYRGRGKPLPYRIQEKRSDLGRGAPWGARQNTHRERWLVKGRRKIGAAPIEIFYKSRAPVGPGGIVEHHSDFYAPKGSRCTKGMTLVIGVLGVANMDTQCPF